MTPNQKTKGQDSFVEIAKSRSVAKRAKSGGDKMTPDQEASIVERAKSGASDTGKTRSDETSRLDPVSHIWGEERTTGQKTQGQHSFVERAKSGTSDKGKTRSDETSRLDPVTVRHIWGEEMTKISRDIRRAGSEQGINRTPRHWSRPTGDFSDISPPQLVVPEAGCECEMADRRLR